jgi:hypothetical protein
MAMSRGLWALLGGVVLVTIAAVFWTASNQANVTSTVSPTVSEQILGLSSTVLASTHEQSVPIFQQLARDHPFGRDDVRATPAVAA